MIRPLAALAAALLTLGAAHPPPHGAPSRTPKRGTPQAVVRLVIVSGTPQRDHAYASHEASKYVTEFAKPLVVRVTGVKDASSAQRRIQFTCVGQDCGFADPERPDGGDRTGPDNYSILTKGGVATLRASITHGTPAATFTVYAEAVAKKGERTVKSKPFTLTTY